MDIAKENHNFALAELLLANFLLHFSSERGSNGGIGRHEGLKIPCPGRGVRVQVPLRVQRNLEKPHNLGTSKGSFFVFPDPKSASMPRNMFLFNNAIYLLPYTGVGSGITRALDEDINVTFMNNDKAQEFVITVWRGKSNQVEDHDTKLRHSDTNLDTGLRHPDTGLRHSDTDLDTRLRHSDTNHDTKRVPLTNKQTHNARKTHYTVHTR